MSAEIEQAMDRLNRAMTALAETRNELARGLDFALDMVSSDVNDLAAIVSAPPGGISRWSDSRSFRIARQLITNAEYRSAGAGFEPENRSQRIAWS